ncbi:DUF6769 family protein [Bacteroides fragilis]
MVGQGDIVGRSGYFSLNLSANSVMRGRLDARRTLKSLVADLRIENLFRPQERRIKNYYAYRESLHGTAVNRAFGLRAPPYPVV